ncbi:MAG: acyltransferase family protein [Akkermansiaceae bacterium]
MVSVLIQSTYVWLMCFSLMRMFCAILGRERKWVRYLSDSSYWLYLLHFPALIAFQMVIRSWPLPSFLKFTITCVVVTGGLLLIYELAVRYTWIGTVLNGRKKRRTSA